MTSRVPLSRELTDRMMRLPRAGRIHQEALRALALAETCTDDSDGRRPVLTRVLWEGGEEITRITGTDTYRLISAQTARTRDCVKPRNGEAWELEGYAIGKATRTKAVRGAEKPEVRIERDGDSAKLVSDGYSEAWEALPVFSGDKPLPYPDWHKVVPQDEAIAWSVRLRLDHLHKALHGLVRTFEATRQGTACVYFMPGEEGLEIQPCVDLVEAGGWPVRHHGCLVQGHTEVEKIEVVPVNAQYLRQVLPRWMEFEGSEAEVMIGIRQFAYPLWLATERVDMLLMPMTGAGNYAVMQCKLHKIGEDWGRAEL